MVKKKGTGFESKFDEVKLREMVKAGMHADAIQEKLKIVSKQSLRQHVLKLINIDRTFYDVPGLYVRNQKLPMINFKGELRLTKKMVAPGEFKHGDKFEIERVDNDQILLVRVKTEQELTEAASPEKGDVEADATVATGKADDKKVAK